jgi:two-component sensor histidine kinase
MVDISELLQEADKLHDRAHHEADPNIRNRLNSMADIYDHLAKIESGNHGGSIQAMVGALSNTNHHS